MIDLSKGLLGACLCLTLSSLCTVASAQTSDTSLPSYPPVSSVRNEIRMQLTPVQSTVLSSEIPGRINALNVKEGESFDIGDTLLTLDCGMHQARLDKAIAQAKEASQILTVNKQLDRLGSISVLEVDVAGSRQAAAHAEASLMTTVVEKCEIRAPFSGKVSVLHVRNHQYVAEGQELMGILDDSTLDVEMVVPSRWISQLVPDQGFQLHIEETDSSYPARITRFGAAIDAVSQSFKVFGRIDGDFPELRAGMSGTARLVN